MSKQEQLAVLLQQASWTDGDLDDVVAMKTVRHLLLPSGLRLPPGGVGRLAGMRGLQSLSAHHTRVEATDMAAIAAAASLWRLDLGGTALTPELLALLQPAPKLKDLWIDGCGVDDHGLAVVAGFPGLEWLAVQHNPITDSGLRELLSLSGLRTLWVGGTEITDAGLLGLAPLQRLTAVNVAGSRASAAGVEALFLAQQELRRAAKRAAAKAVPHDAGALVEATKVLHEFLEAMADWNSETARRAAKGGEDRSFEAERISAKRAIFDRYCTARERVYDAPELLTYSPGGGSRVPVEVLSVDQLGPDRIEVTLRKGPNQRLLYVLLRRRGRWLVDHNKMWMDGGWSDYSLNLVC